MLLKPFINVLVPAIEGHPEQDYAVVCPIPPPSNPPYNPPSGTTCVQVPIYGVSNGAGGTGSVTIIGYQTVCT